MCSTIFEGAKQILFAMSTACIFKPTNPPTHPLPMSVRCPPHPAHENITNRYEKSPLCGFCGLGPCGDILELVHNARPSEAGRSRGHRAALSCRRPQRPGDNHLRRQGRALLGQRHVSLYPGACLTMGLGVKCMVGTPLDFVDLETYDQAQPWGKTLHA